MKSPHHTDLTSPDLLEFCAWRDDLLAASPLEYTPIPFADMEDWAIEDGALRHTSGGFFAVAGLAVRSRIGDLDGQEQLALLQHEDSLKGLLLRQRGDGWQLLLQARLEPANVDQLQLAPTVQASESNLARTHGGRATPFADWFGSSQRGMPVLDELQSGIATRYYGKCDRTAATDVSAIDDFELPPGFRWFDLDAIRSFVLCSGVLNSATRSLLASLDWSIVAEDAGPFAGHENSSFGEMLHHSHNAGFGTDDYSDAAILTWLQRLRVHAAPRHRIQPLEQLTDWVVEDDTIRPRSGVSSGFSARAYRIHAKGREVETWDQPMLDSESPGRVSLIAQERHGTLRFLVKARAAIGHPDGLQCSASITIAPGASPRENDPVERTLRARIELSEGADRLHACRQSEDGGRLHHDENEYEVIRLDPTVELPESNSYRWMTLAQIRRLIKVPGVFDFEMRSALTLLLHYL